MAHQKLDRVQETSISVGTGALTLAGIVAGAGMRTFAAAGMVNADTCWLLIQNQSVPTEVEISLGTLNAGAFTRSAVQYSSNANAVVSFSAGTKLISLIAPASKSPIADASGNFVFGGAIIATGVRESVSGALSPVAGALTFDLSLFTTFLVSLTGAVTALTISNMLAGYAGSFTVEVTANGTAYTWAMPASVVALNGAYVPSSANGKRDLLSFMTFDGGTTWRMIVVAQNY